MTVEDKKAGLMGGKGAVKDLFPVGMRVLAVDDDPTCLMVLERFLCSCKYQVTTTNQAIKALEMLRENKDKFDLVISDVNMPDMDGFKLLELVGLEMDLPVIMLSAHSDPKLVMKGITHGACDYLLKPVRIEEIKNIWQHVVRRKFGCIDRNKSTSTDRPHGQGGNEAANVAGGDPTAKLNKKRKDQIDEEDDDGEDTGHDNEDPSTQKKPRVVWSVELHRKFVAAVNQLGLDKAVPKKILDLMNVEGLTRENVASHLQKYRLYLKRLSNVASQQANIVAALGSKDPSYIRMSPLDRFGDFRALAESRRLSNMSISSYPPSGMLGRLNTPANLSSRGITTSGLIHKPNLTENMSGSVSTTMGKLLPGTVPPSQNASFYPIMPSMELNQMQQSKPATHAGEFSGIDDPTKCSAATSITDNWRTDSSSPSSISLYNQTSSHAFLQGGQQKTQNRGNHEIQSSVGGGSTPFSSLHVDRVGSSYKDPCDTWRGREQLHGLPSVNPLPPGGHAQLPLSNGGNDSLHIHDNRMDFSTNLAMSGSLKNSRGDAQCQTGLLGNVVSSLSYAQIDRLGEHNQNRREISSQPLSHAKSLAGVSTSVPICSGGPSENPRVTLCNRSSELSRYSQQISPSTLQHAQIGSSSINSNTRCSENYFTDQVKDGIYQVNYSLDELMDAMIKQEQNEPILMDGNMGFDPYPLGSCI